MRPQITRDIAKDRYLIAFDGVEYYFPYELLKSVQDYYTNYRGTVEGWYSDLPAADKKKVERRGLPPMKGDEFYPDVVPE